MALKHIVCALAVAASCTFAAPLYADSEGSSVSELKRESRELGEALQEYGADQKDQAEDSINRMLSALDKRIAELEQELSENWDDMSNTTRQRAKNGFSDAYEALSEQWNETERDLSLDQDKKNQDKKFESI